MNLSIDKHYLFFPENFGIFILGLIVISVGLLDLNVVEIFMGSALIGCSFVREKKEEKKSDEPFK